MPVQGADPYSAYSFLVTVNGVSDDGQAVSWSFTEVGELEREVTPIEYRNGSERVRSRRQPSPTNMPPV